VGALLLFLGVIKPAFSWPWGWNSNHSPQGATFMDVLIRERIMELRRRGHSYTDIARDTGVSRETVKSLCRRAGISPDEAIPPSRVCERCGEELSTRAAGKRFCSTACRLAWWHAHPERLNRKAIYSFTCAGCGQPFSAYGKYCSHRCYIRTRFGTCGGRATSSAGTQ